MNNKINGILILLGFIAVIGYMSLFQVYQTDYALMLRLGKVVRADFEPGLHMKLPFVHRIRFFERRILTLDSEPEHFLTREKKNLIVDSFVKWHIVDVVKYFTAMGGEEQRAADRLRTVIADGLRSEFGTRTIQEVISGDRAEIMSLLNKEANERVGQFGIEVVDVRIKRIDLPEEVSHSVYRRMEAERARVAKELRSRGEAEAVRIRASADRERVETLADAKRDSEIIRGEGEAQSAATYAKAYKQDPEFYRFYRSLDAYRNTFRDKGDLLVLEPDTDFFDYFKQTKPNEKNGK